MSSELHDLVTDASDSIDGLLFYLVEESLLSDSDVIEDWRITRESLRHVPALPLTSNQIRWHSKIGDCLSKAELAWSRGQRSEAFQMLTAAQDWLSHLAADRSFAADFVIDAQGTAFPPSTNPA